MSKIIPREMFGPYKKCTNPLLNLQDHMWGFTFTFTYFMINLQQKYGKGEEDNDIKHIL